MKRHIALNQEILSLFLRNKGGAKVYCENNNVNLMKPQNYFYWNCKQYDDPLNALFFLKSVNVLCDYFRNQINAPN